MPNNSTSENDPLYSSKMIIGNDDRTRINDSTIAPYKPIVVLPSINKIVMRRILCTMLTS
jgi:V8-like Glu-specific endopeptidase